MRTICVLNLKGGVAKTTTVINLADQLARAGKKVLVVDADSQCNTTEFFCACDAFGSVPKTILLNVYGFCLIITIFEATPGAAGHMPQAVRAGISPSGVGGLTPSGGTRAERPVHKSPHRRRERKWEPAPGRLRAETTGRRRPAAEREVYVQGKQRQRPAAPKAQRMF